MLILLITIACIHLHACQRPEEPVVQSARSRHDLNQRFQRIEGWTGGDGAYSVKLPNGRMLWLFSDTWVGKVENSKRVDATIVNNSVGVQTEDKVEYSIRRDTTGKPQAMITPPDGRGWHWLFAGSMVKEKLLIFMPQLEKTNEKSVFGFRTMALWLGVVGNPLDTPTSWNVQSIKIPHAEYSSKRERSFGSALLSDGGFLYIYGTDEDSSVLAKRRQLIVARAKLETADDPGSWEFYGQGAWHKKVEKAEPVADEMASEASVIQLPQRNQYLLVYTRNGLSKEIRGRLAANPWGPWSPPATLYVCPEASWDHRIFCYAGKAHAMLNDGNRIIVSYVANSFDFWHVASDARLYWPRFVEVQLK